MKKPSWYPPRIAFPVVWTLLYIAMGVASFLVWREMKRATDPKKAANAREALWWYGGQLLINLVWPLTLFGARSVTLAVATMLALIASVGCTIAAFVPVNRTAAWLMAPYGVWICFAFVLMCWIARANP